MPVDTRISVPFLPQEGVTGQILQALQLANEQHVQRQQLGLQQQQLQMQQAAQPSEINLREAQKASLDAQTKMEQLNLDLRRQMIGSLLGGQQQPGEPQVETTNAVPGTGSGLIANVANKALTDDSLTAPQKTAIGLAARQGMLHVLGPDPSKALDGIVSTYNDAVKENQQTERTLHTETLPDSQSNTGYSTRAVSANGNEAWRIPVPPPLPKNLEEATALVGSATNAYKSDPTPGNKNALDLLTAQHDAMYKDHIREVSEQARQQAMARGADFEAMVRTGKNPITGEVLNLNNAPPSALVNPANGQVVPTDMISLYKPTPEERQTADTARQVLAISQDLKNQITKNPDLIGPLAGRSQQALQKIGISAGDAAKLIDDVSFLQSAATKMHTGRFSAQILEKMDNLIKPGMSADEFNGSLDSINDVASRYANEDKLTTAYEYQQRQQYESQQAKAAPTGGGIPAGAIPGSLGGKHGYVLNGQFHED